MYVGFNIERACLDFALNTLSTPVFEYVSFFGIATTTDQIAKFSYKLDWSKTNRTQVNQQRTVSFMDIKKISLLLIYHLLFKKNYVAPSEGLEPSTHALTVRCSTELSYDGPVNKLTDTAILRICGDI